jgi:hypothetical protein
VLIQQASQRLRFHFTQADENLWVRSLNEIGVPTLLGDQSSFGRSGTAMEFVTSKLPDWKVKGL